MLELSLQEINVILLSLKIAFTASLFSLPVGIFLAYILARKEFIFKNILTSLINLPLILPPVVTGYILLITFGANGYIGNFLNEKFNFTFAFKWTGAALACAVMGFPLMVRSIRLSIEMVDHKVEQAARTLGASTFFVFLTITLPVAFPGIIVGFTLSFARALGEFGATITFVSNIPGETQTLSAAIYTLLQIPNGEVMAFRLTILSIIISLTALYFSEVIYNKSVKSRFKNEK